MTHVRWFGLTILMILSAGCAGNVSDPAPDASLPSGMMWDSEVGTVQIELAGGSALYSPLKGESKISGNEMTVEMKDGSLQINGKSFGEMKKGDKVKVDKSGTVFVNGKERETVE